MVTIKIKGKEKLVMYKFVYSLKKKQKDYISFNWFLSNANWKQFYW